MLIVLDYKEMIKKKKKKKNNKKKKRRKNGNYIFNFSYTYNQKCCINKD